MRSASEVEKLANCTSERPRSPTVRRCHLPRSTAAGRCTTDRRQRHQQRRVRRTGCPGHSALPTLDDDGPVGHQLLVSSLERRIGPASALGRPRAGPGRNDGGSSKERELITVDLGAGVHSGPGNSEPEDRRRLSGLLRSVRGSGGTCRRALIPSTGRMMCRWSKNASISETWASERRPALRGLGVHETHALGPGGLLDEPRFEVAPVALVERVVLGGDEDDAFPEVLLRLVVAEPVDEVLGAPDVAGDATDGLPSSPSSR